MRSFMCHHVFLFYGSTNVYISNDMSGRWPLATCQGTDSQTACACISPPAHANVVAIQNRSETVNHLMSRNA